MADDNSTFGGVLVAGVVAASLITAAVVAVINADAGPRALDGGPLHRVELAAENTQGFNEAMINSGFPAGPLSLAEGRAVCHDMLGTLENVLEPKYGPKRAVDFVNLSHQHLCKIVKVDGSPVQ